MKIEFTPDPALYPFESRWFDSSAGRVHYIDEGTGPPMLFFHGNPTWSFLYRRIVIGLRDRFRCVAVDYLGFGLSDRPPGFGYTIEEHSHVVGELVDHLRLENLVTVGQDWGGPISMAVDVARADRIRGVVLGNTWFWPTDALRMKTFSRVMSTRRMQRAILEKNFFVERLVPNGTARHLSPREMDHYRLVQPSPEARRGIAEMPRQIRAAAPLLQRLAREVPALLGSKPALLVWGMKDFAFPPRLNLPRMQAAFPDHVLIELPRAKHYIQEDAPDRIADTIVARFG
ncbi:haloalkane dehalogenase [Rhodococcus daqingensis]|uniref:Haloalkane dehalogenase n=1 Tax=Rhodococcus daqingensis TaxID=2479363 RepID=A0ABW2S0Y6_9NOCA